MDDQNSLENNFFRQNEIILRGKKRTDLFQTYSREKFCFSTRSKLSNLCANGFELGSLSNNTDKSSTAL